MSQLGVGCQVPGRQSWEDCDPEQPLAGIVGEIESFRAEDCDAVDELAPCLCPWWKRAMDVAGAFLGLLVLSPLLCGLAVFIKCVSPGPVLFRQSRFGLGGRPFTLLKLRTIHLGKAPQRHSSYVSELIASNRPLKKIDEELPIIPGGKLIRKLALDELPQLLNVMKGEMSLIGPRPDVLPVSSYQPWQRHRFKVRPGLSGLWQVSGKNETTFSTMMRLDVLYVRRRSIWLDLSILLRTLPAILRG